MVDEVKDSVVEKFTAHEKFEQVVVIFFPVSFDTVLGGYEAFKRSFRFLRLLCFSLKLIFLFLSISYSYTEAWRSDRNRGAGDWLECWLDIWLYDWLECWLD